MKEYLKQLYYNLYILFFISSPKEDKKDLNIPDNYTDAESEIDCCSVCGKWDWIDVMRDINHECFCPKCYYKHIIKEWIREHKAIVPMMVWLLIFIPMIAKTFLCGCLGIICYILLCISYILTDDYMEKEKGKIKND